MELLSEPAPAVVVSPELMLAATGLFGSVNAFTPAKMKAMSKIKIKTLPTTCGGEWNGGRRRG